MSARTEKKRLSLIAPTADSIVNFRGPLVRALRARGWEVFAFAPDYGTETRSAVASLGAQPVDLSLARARMNPLRDLGDLVRLSRQLRDLAPDVNFASTIKPVIYGTLAAWMAGVPSRFAMIEGAGHLFTDDGRTSFRRAVVRWATMALYWLSLGRAQLVIVLNEDDRRLFVGSSMVSGKKVALVEGIGVDLAHFAAWPAPAGPLCFLFVGRLLREKGVYDFIAAARRVKEVDPSARFVLLGGTDPNPTSVSPEEIGRWRNEGVVELAGQVADVRPLLREASVFVLPSYREGLPRSTQEAMAMGRAVITTDVPGCRATVREGENGFIVPVRNPAALADAMLRFVRRPALVAEMGRCSRSLAEARFDVRRINEDLIGLMQL